MSTVENQTVTGLCEVWSKKPRKFDIVIETFYYKVANIFCPGSILFSTLVVRMQMHEDQKRHHRQHYSYWSLLLGAVVRFWKPCQIIGSWYAELCWKRLWWRKTGGSWGPVAPFMIPRIKQSQKRVRMRLSRRAVLFGHQECFASCKILSKDWADISSFGALLTTRRCCGPLKNAEKDVIRPDMWLMGAFGAALIARKTYLPGELAIFWFRSAGRFPGGVGHKRCGGCSKQLSADH